VNVKGPARQSSRAFYCLKISKGEKMIDKRGSVVNSLDAICQEALSLEECGIYQIDCYNGIIWVCECPKGWTALSTDECIPPDGIRYKFTVKGVS